MTAADIADMLHARRIGCQRWQTKCPSHPDRHPSLAISQGQSGVLLKCWSAGCSPERIVKAMGLPMSALFDASLAPEQRKQAVQAKAARDNEQAHQRAADRQQRDRVYKLEKLRDALGAMLARDPDDGKIGRLFHCACERWHDVESALYHDPQDGPLRYESSPAVPQRMADALAEIGQTFNAKEPAR
jgi:hypothetical protein